MPATQTAEAVSQHGARLRWTPSVVGGPARVRLRAAGLPRRARGRLTWAGRTVRVRTDRHGAFARTLRVTATTARGRRGAVHVRARRLAFAVGLQPAPAPAPGPGPVDPPGLDVPPLTLPAFASGGDPVVAAAGDIACDPADASFNAGLGSPRYCRQFWTYRLVAAMAPTAVLGLGDFQYENGTLAAYRGSYDRSWGHLKGITHPAPGNDHDSSGAGDYLAYWASRLPSSAPYEPYSFDVGSWHLVSLPSNCRNANVDCSTGGTLDRWLQADLEAHRSACTLAFWHNPRWNSPSATHPSSEFNVDAFAQTLYDHGAEVVLSGDNHNYERFAPQNGTGARDDAKGLTQFVVGTGGKVLMPFVGTAPNSVARDDQHFGALRLALHADVLRVAVRDRDRRRRGRGLEALPLTRPPRGQASSSTRAGPAGATGRQPSGGVLPGGKSARTEPPKPPPMIRAPAAPAARSRAASASTVGVDTANWSRSEAWDASRIGPSAATSPRPSAAAASSTRASSWTTCRARPRSGAGRPSACSSVASRRAGTPSRRAASAHSSRRSL